MSLPNLASLIAARFFSDGKRIVYDASDGGRPARAWLQDLNSSTPRPITPEGVMALMPSPDDHWLVAGQPAGTNAFINASLVSVENGEPKKIQGLKADETVLGWTRDGQLYISSPANGERNAIRVDRLNPHTGQRIVWRELRMPPIGGVFPDPPIITPDGSSYGFDYRLRLSDLYTVTGVR
jgi:hypothetical protein